MTSSLLNDQAHLPRRELVGNRNHEFYSGQVQRFVRCLRITIWDTPTFAMLSQPNATHQLLLSNRNPTAAGATESHAAADHQPYNTLVSDTYARQKHEPRATQTNSSEKLSLTRVSFTELPSSVAPQWYDWNHTTNDGRRLYRRPPVPALSPTDAAWADAILHPPGVSA